MKITFTKNEVETLQAVAEKFNIRDKVNEGISAAVDKSHLSFNNESDGGRSFDLNEQITHVFIGMGVGITDAFIPYIKTLINLSKGLYEVSMNLIKNSEGLKADLEKLTKPYTWDNRIEMFHIVDDVEFPTASVVDGELTIHNQEYFYLDGMIDRVSEILREMPPYFKGSNIEKRYIGLLASLYGMK